MVLAGLETSHHRTRRRRRSLLHAAHNHTEVRTLQHFCHSKSTIDYPRQQRPARYVLLEL